MRFFSFHVDISVDIVIVHVLFMQPSLRDPASQQIDILVF